MGRKKIMAISLLGSGLGLGLQSWAIWREWSLGMFFVTRVLTGVFSGSAPVAKAFLADIGDEREREEMAMDVERKRRQRGMDCKEEERKEQGDKQNSGKNKGIVAQYLGWRDAASTLSYIVGPALGGILYEVVRCWGNSPSKSSFDTSMTWLNQGRPFDGKAYAAVASDGRARALATVIGVAGLGSLIASLMVMAFVKDHRGSMKDEKDQKMKDSTSQSSSQLEEAVKKDLEIISCPLGQSLWSGVATVCAISFLYHIADSTFFAFYPALLQNQMNFDAKAIGMSFTAFACVSFLCSATSLSKKIIEKAGVVNACAFGLSAIGAGLFGLSTSASSFVSEGVMKLLTFAAAGLYFAGVPLYGPTIPTMLLLCVPPYQRGAGK
jgi:MFS family permease